MTRVRSIAGSSLGRILIGFVLVAAVFASAWLWSLSGPLTDTVIEQQRGSLTAVAQSAALLLSQSREDPSVIAEQLVARTNMRLTIVASDGTVLVDSDIDPAKMENHGNRPEIAEALDGRIGTNQRVSRTEGNEQLYVAVPGTLGGERIAVRVSQPLDRIKRIASDSRHLGLLLLGAATAIAVAVAVQTARTAAQPIAELSGAAERMAAGNLSVRIPDVPTDLNVLAQSLQMLKNQMRARLEALEAERRTLRSTLDGLNDAVIVLEGDTVRLANREADRMFRRPVSGWEGTRLESSSLPASVASVVMARASSGDSDPVELEPDPVGRTYRVLVAPLDPEEHGGRSIVVIGDVTQRAQLDRVRRDFVANASHELKTPVAGIGLLAQSAELAAADGDDEQAVEFARQIAAEVTRLQRLVADLLDLSRLESVPGEDAVTDVRQAVDLALVSHRSAAARKHIFLECDLSAIANDDVFVAAHPTDVAIGLDNLVDNAIAYTESGFVKVSVSSTPTTAVISVIDSGPGIPPEHVPRIFERFYRIDRGRSREAGGTGLGLSLVKHVVERNGGTVTVDSREGEGTTFTFTLPRA